MSAPHVPEAGAPGGGAPGGGVPACRTSGTGTDLRLGGTAAGCWAAALVGLRLPATAGLVVAVVAALSAAIVAMAVYPRWASRCRSDVLVVVAQIVMAVACGVVIGASATAARVAQRDAEPLAGLAADHAVIVASAVVSEDPRSLASARGEDTVIFRADLVRVALDGAPPFDAAGRIVVIASGAPWRRVVPWQRIEAAGRLAPPRGGDLTAAVLIVGSDPARTSRPPLVARVAGRLRAGLRSACAPLPADVGGLLPGLSIGDTGRLDPALAADFRTTGMTHLCAVSGSNCAIIIGAMLWLTRWCRAGPGMSALACFVALVGFVILVRASPSVLRAAVMGALALAALAAGRARAALPALGAAVIVLLLVDPALAVDQGFALSVLATAGLLLMVPGWSEALRVRGVPLGIAGVVVVPAVAQVACAPVIAAMSGTISLTAVPVNLLATPAVPPATILGVTATMLAPVWGGGAQFVAWLGSWPAAWLVWLAHAGAAVPAGQVSWPDHWRGGLLLALVLAGVMGLARVRAIRRVLLVVIVSLGLGALPVRCAWSGWPPEGWFLAMCDVGQGDATVLAVAPGQGVVIDTGPEPGAVNTCLRLLGVKSVPLLIISHFHADHVGGLGGVEAGRAIGVIVIPEHATPATELAEPAGHRDRAGPSAIAALGAHGSTRVERASRGRSYTIGAVRLDVLAPGAPAVGTRSDANNTSLVLRAVVRGHSVLLGGDAETEQQAEMLSSGTPADLASEVLKVPHHGSAYQDPAWLAAVSSTVALISVGRGNTLGHPSTSTLRCLAAGGARVVRTDRAGDVTLAPAARGRLAVFTRPTGNGRVR